MKVGIMALQGDVPEQRAALARFVRANEISLVRAPSDLDGLDAMILPGGESTTMAQLLESTGLGPALRERIAAGLPVLATCAGLILLSRELERGSAGKEPTTWPVLDVIVRRNDYGRQRESFEAPVRVDGVPGRPFPGVFIRAPKILSLGPGTQPIAFRGEEVVGVRAGLVWGLAFHPELSGDPRLHARFLREARNAQKTQKKSRKATKKKAAPKRKRAQ